MAAVTVAEMRVIEAAAMARGHSEEELLTDAGERLGIALGRHFPQAGTAIGYLGKGHNAGDALVALRILRDRFHWKVETRNAYPTCEFADLSRKKWVELGLPSALDHPPRWRDIQGPLLLLDGLAGTGISGALRAPLASLAGEMRWLRQDAAARVAAVDLPSGMDPDSGRIDSTTVIADVTFMIGNAKRGLLNGHAATATGALALVPVDSLTVSQIGDCELISPQMLGCGKTPRPFDLHKGTAGRVSIFAGSVNYPGAAVLTAMGALRGGAGLVTLFTPENIHPVVAAKCPPEIIVRGIEDPLDLLDFPGDAIVLGCGLGVIPSPMAKNLRDLIAKSTLPMVIDADALNSIAQSGSAGIFRKNHVLTPHPGEFARLAPDLSALPREQAARTFSDRIPSTLLLKGCRTLVTRQGQPLWCNSTGNPGMATAGQGDLLAGLIGARLAAGDDPLEAAALAAWTCGRAAEIARDARHLSEESLTTSDVLHFLGAAFKDWRGSLR
jgi:hydroxyethylthiazole kinase-like uncharacterized protein yjeF